MIQKIQICSVGLPKAPAVSRQFLGWQNRSKTQLKPLDLFGRRTVRFKIKFRLI
jgi:hypothetical protein